MQATSLGMHIVILFAGTVQYSTETEYAAKSNEVHKLLYWISSCCTACINAVLAFLLYWLVCSTVTMTNPCTFLVLGEWSDFNYSVEKVWIWSRLLLWPFLSSLKVASALLLLLSEKRQVLQNPWVILHCFSWTRDPHRSHWPLMTSYSNCLQISRKSLVFSAFQGCILKMFYLKAQNERLKTLTEIVCLFA